jgi:hypothetical protein
MRSKIVRRIDGESGVFSFLTGLAPADLQSLMLAVYQARAARIDLAQVIATRRGKALFASSDVDARLFTRFDAHAFACARDFQAIDLAPVCPLGTTQGLGGIDQNNVLTGIRNAEVLGDSTPGLALECALRRKNPADRKNVIRLAATHRVIRLQPFDTSGFTPHFRLFALASAGRDRGSHRFEMESLSEHIRFYLNFFRALNADGFSFGSTLVEISDVGMTRAILEKAGVAEELREVIRAHRPQLSDRFLRDRSINLPEPFADPASQLEELRHRHGVDDRRLAAVKAEVFDPLATEFPDATFQFNLARLEGIGYYTGLALRISPAGPDGMRFPIVDGGFVDWTARLLQDKKERLLTSGIGSEFACRSFVKAPR